LLKKPWLRDAEIVDDWGNNTMTIQGNGTIKTIVVTKHLGTNVKYSKVLLCYNYQNGINDEEKNIIFATKLEFFSIGTINLPNTFQSIDTTKSHKGTKIQNHCANMSSTKFILVEGKITNRYEPRVTLEDKVYLKTYYKHQLGNV
jgi:hypothetical protein